MKYSFIAKDEYDIIASITSESGKISKDLIEITIQVEIDRKKFEALNNKYEKGLSGRIEKLLK